ncbi:MAG: zf-HC2 domain-containing protein [Chloroflexota bacterium]|nr:zf-HC2 domain-containing protein [Chloroflexota bacterium]
MSGDTPHHPIPTGPDPGAAAAPADAALSSRHLDLDAFSAYLDHQLPPAEMAAARAHLATCPACRRELAELRATVALVRGLPHYAPRRGFQLGPAHARRAHGRGRYGADWFARLVPALPALRIATVAVAVLLVAVIAGDLVTSRDAANVALRSTSELEVVVDAPDEAMPAAPPQAPAAESGQPRSVMPRPTVTMADEAESFAESAPADGTDRAVPASHDADGAPEDAPGLVAAEPAAPAAPSPPPPSGWRLAQVGLGLALVWLIVSLAGIARYRRTRSAAALGEPTRQQRR